MAVAVIAAATVSSCKRHVDPYEDWKAPQLLDEGERLLRNGDLAQADAVFKRGREVAEKRGFKANDLRVFDRRRLYIAAAQENLPLATQLYGEAGGGNDYRTMDVRIGMDLVMQLVRAGKMDDARKLAERLAQRFQGVPPANDEELSIYTVGWIAIDRLRTDNVEIERAKQASNAVVEVLSNEVEKAVLLKRPLNSAERLWLLRYVDHLFDTERSLVAQKIADFVERIDQAAPSGTDAKPCLPLDPMFPALGCIPEWPAPAKAGT